MYYVSISLLSVPCETLSFIGPRKNIIGLLGTYSIEIYISYIFNSLYFKADVCRLPFAVNVILNLFIVKLLTRIEYVIPG